MSEVPQAERELLANAERRIARLLVLLTPAGTAVAAWQWGAKTGAAFALGGGLAYLNYRWVVAIVDGLMQAQQGSVPRRTYLKLLLPLLLLGGLLYVIFVRSWLPPVGVLSGLLLLVAAVLLEAAYQIVVAVRQGT